MSFSFDSNGPVHNAILQVLGPGSTCTSNFIQFNLWNEKTFELHVDYQMQQAISYLVVGIAQINFTDPCWAAAFFSSSTNIKFGH
ncbi:MAG: hypothetical protein Q8S14_18200 [Algoriphagus sp.]|uniref:hypothetical protein n=1 Tax=Algoriphagus sp. TaxID=1872435 RepID=UPI002730BB3B|nr:hypothetical protein [Algoriphagus sp.]MDP2043276.1 hypothetical protein [Algoriphagus sp.]MDP3473808.1 hypothetical protein [Algoriphagus sp.]